ncbi:MAG: class I SAM-dependent methyltransferase [Nitrospinae bacterium]|nr:class I SAM-dependent methyltransferase [Nitrospinota bacterium]
MYEGYQRGWGLQFGDLQKAILADPLYQEGVALATNRTIVAELNRMNLFLLIRYYLPFIETGDIIEFGSYKGGNALFMAYLADRLLPGVKVYALDSFEGMPATDKAVDAHNPGDFSDVDLDELHDFADASGLKNLVFVKGYFEDTAADVLVGAKKIALAHIDCDIRPAVLFSYEAVRPFMVDHGYIVLDDATVSSCIGATEVVEETLIRRDGLHSEQIFPHYVFRAPEAQR